MNRPAGGRPLKLCYVGPGDLVHLERWAGYFARQGERVSVVSLAGRGNYPLGVRQLAFRLGGLGYRLRLILLGWLLRCSNPDLVHVHWAEYAGPVAKVWRGRLVVTVYGSDIYRIEEFSEKDQESIRFGLRTADLITCDSDDLVARTAEVASVNRENIKNVQWGVDTDRFCLGDRSIRWTNMLGVEGRPVILSPRNFAEIYNLDVIIRAFAQVRLAMPLAVLVLKNREGKSAYVEAMCRLISELDLEQSVRIVDMVSYEEMVELYRLAEVTVSVPWSDGTPMSVLEAMSCGSVPVVSDLPSLREWVRDGWNGYLVQVGDVDALAAGILRVLDNPVEMKDFARRNREIVMRRASQRDSMDFMGSLYRELVFDDRKDRTT